MTLQRPDHFALDSVPNLQISHLRANCEGVPIAGPLDRSDAIGWSNVTQFGHLAILGIPHVNARAETDSKRVLGRPIDKV